MAEPLTAEYRISLHIVVGGLTHLLRVYCEASPSLLAASGYFVFDRSGLATIDAGDAAQAWWNALRTLYGTSILAPVWFLENRSGVIWNPVATGSLTGAGTVTGSFFDATQLTFSMRTSVFTRIRFVVLEQNKTQNPDKIQTLSELSASYGSAIAQALDGSDGNSDGIFNWARSKAKRELHSAAPFVSMTWDLNDKVRRARNLQ
jgi:hypothetical protein